MHKLNYGIDAPPVISRLFFVGIICLLIGCAFYFIFSARNDALSVFLTFLYTGVGFLFGVLYMLFSSLYGKFRMRDKLISYLKIIGDEQILDVGCKKTRLIKKLNQNTPAKMK